MKAIARVVMLCLAGSLGACAVMGGGPAKSDPVTVENGKAFAGKKDVIIGSFDVRFITFDKSSSKAESPMISSDSGYAKAVLRARLLGIDDATFQKLTDQAYADFRQQLTSHGYHIVDHGKLESTPSYGRLNIIDSPHKTTSSMKLITGGSREDATFAPTGMPLYKDQGDYVMTPSFWMYTIADEAKVPVLSVRYDVHFVYFGANSSSHKTANGRDYNAEVTLGQGVQVVGGKLSGIEIAVAPGSTFKNPNGGVKAFHSIVSPDSYGTTSDATSGLQKAANTFSAVMGVFSGGSMSAKELNITAEPDKYSAAATDVLKQANARLVSKMAALR